MENKLTLAGKASRISREANNKNHGLRMRKALNTICRKRVMPAARKGLAAVMLNPCYAQDEYFRALADKEGFRISECRVAINKCTETKIVYYLCWTVNPAS